MLLGAVHDSRLPSGVTWERRTQPCPGFGGAGLQPERGKGCFRGGEGGRGHLPGPLSSRNAQHPAVTSQRNQSGPAGPGRLSLVPSSSPTHTASSASLPSQPSSPFSSLEARAAVLASASRSAATHGPGEPLHATVPPAASLGPTAPHHLRQLRPASPPVPERPALDYGPEDVAFRASLPCLGSPLARHHHHPAAALARPCAQLGCPGSASQEGRYAKRADQNLELDVEEGSEKRGFVTRQEFLAVEQELEEVRAELKSLQRQVQHIGEAVQPLAEEGKLYNGYTLRELKAMVRAEQDPYKAAHKILLALFSDACLPPPPPSASPLQQPPSPKASPKPSLNPELYTVYCDILQTIFPGLGSRAVKERTQSV